MDRAQILEHIKESTMVSESLNIQCMNEDGPKLVYVIYLRNSLAVGTDEDPVRLAYSNPLARSWVNVIKCKKQVHYRESRKRYADSDM